MTATAAHRPRAAGRWLVVANPRAQAGSEALREALRRFGAPLLRGDGVQPRGVVDRVEVVETRGDGRDVARIATALGDGDRRGGNGCRGQPFERIIAAGGDGTMREVIQALFADATSELAGSDGPGFANSGLRERPSLAVLPLGTANNFARALGLESVRRGGTVALDAAISAAVHGDVCDIDLGECNQHYFAGSLAIGCDANILARRNRLRALLGLTGDLGGYPLYLAACALELARRHGATVRLRVDSPGASNIAVSTTGGTEVVRSDARFTNLLVTTTPIYAGEFRFVSAPGPLADGALDLHVCQSRREYLREYATGWRRHVRAARGEAVAASRRVRTAGQIVIAAPRPLAWQLDGEEQSPTDRFRIRVLPAAMRIHRPRALS